MDRIDKERRSWNMSRIKAQDTRPELRVRSLLHRLGLRFRLNNKDLPGKPDLVLPKFRTAVFVHGCFWHRHPGCSFAYTPKSNLAFWNTKFSRNIHRDAQVTDLLRALGWNQVIIWECELRDVDKLTNRLSTLFGCFRNSDPMENPQRGSGRHKAP